ncbi:MAG TPA: aminotransferase class I/II-fold pyridoxal phosphate-dependent enzyme, partial [Chromatiales bacterium]|nr:aminotransferase class I/II-fold pyridoxal phosphate-dependent enzyme [Chromatiales bacterium]
TLEPTFGEYAAAARAAGVEHLATYGPEAFLEALPGAGVAFLAQPDNPGGEVHEAAFLDEAARRARAGGARLVVDLAYAPLVEGGVPRPAEALQLYAPNKAHGLVGVRAGYLVLPPGLAAESLVEAAPSWVIGPAAVAFLEAQAGEAARAWVRSTRPRLWLWRSALAASLRALGYEVREGAANFLMARLGEAAAGRLRRRSIRVRPLDDKGLPDWARLSAQPPAALAALVAALEECG